jgi:hypothetical protein
MYNVRLFRIVTMNPPYTTNNKMNKNENEIKMKKKKKPGLPTQGLGLPDYHLFLMKVIDYSNGVYLGLS